MFSLGIEISPGGTSVVALDLESATLAAQAWVAHPPLEILPNGRREQDPARWISAVDAAVRQCLATLGTGRSRVAAIGVAAPLRGMVVLDAANRVMRPVRLAGDPSATPQAEELARTFGGAPGLLELAGQVPGADSAAAECLWLKQQEPQQFQNAAAILTTQDFIAYWLTGVRGTDPASASATGLLDIRTRQWSAALIDCIDPRLGSMLPPLAAPDAPRGTLRPEIATAWGLADGIIVGAGGPAPMLAALAAGCTAAGGTSVRLESTGEVTGVAHSPVIDLMGEITPLCHSAGGWLGLAETLGTALVPELLRHHHGWSAGQFDAFVASAPPGADGLLWLPYPGGESVPRLPDATGVLHGITPRNFTPAHLARATAEGVALGLGYAVSRLRELGVDPPEIRLSGTGAANPWLGQLLADVTGVAVLPVSGTQGPATGAAMQAALALFQTRGGNLGIEALTRHLVATDPAARREPDPQRHALYQELLSRQQYLVETLHSAGFL